MYGNHCMLDVHTWKAALVSASVCHDCRSLHAAQASYISHTAWELTLAFAAFLG